MSTATTQVATKNEVTFSSKLLEALDNKAEDAINNMSEEDLKRELAAIG